ncbi:hypothetical protein [Saccharopolyspora elongata]|uniref:Uncharacterized protein n=1 Tax=Saccharopolyspora elongata TaxID=2530387 RepID=A0A4R4Y3L4_9PSEU|nr:hypothetical protein [Saccharopolyspora elongata]TDD38958.1 hypothetical protein E1288_37905 [Saccharopolyspora elongata]
MFEQTTAKLPAFSGHTFGGLAAAEGVPAEAIARKAELFPTFPSRFRKQTGRFVPVPAFSSCLGDTIISDE